MYIKLKSEALSHAIEKYPVVILSGAAQVEKTFLSRLVSGDLSYFSFADPDVKILFKNDPDSFAVANSSGIIFDGVDDFPTVIDFLHKQLEGNSSCGPFILIVRSNFLADDYCAQLPNGCAYHFMVLPLSYKEIGSNCCDWQGSFILGGYPGCHKQGISPTDYYLSYISTYVGCDVHGSLKNRDWDKFCRFMRLCARRVGMVITLIDFAKELGVSLKRVCEWFNVLNEYSIIFSLLPWGLNRQDKIKIYFYDTGLLSHLLGISCPQDIGLYGESNYLFKNLVVSEIVKMQVVKHGTLKNAYFWRDHRGMEIDLIIERNNVTHAIEIKSAATFRPDYLKNIVSFRSFAPRVQGHLVYNGVIEGKHQDVSLLSFLSRSPA